MIPNQAEFPLAWLAVIEAGAVSVPLNPKYTAREAEFVLTDAGASWLVITAELLGRHGTATFAPVPAGNVIVAGEPVPGAHSFADLLATPAAAGRHEAQPRDLVGIQFTSGTTGLPKGCMLTHEYWLHMGVYGAAMYGNGQRILADHPFYYMQNQAYFMSALAAGGQLLITPGLSRSKFMGWLIDHEIDFAWIDEDLLNLPPSADDKRLRLKRAPVAGLPGELHRALEERFDLKARESLALERGRVMMAAESDAHFNVQNFYDTWEEKTRELIAAYLPPAVPPERREFYVDLVRVIQNGVILSAVEHPKYWTPAKQEAFIDALLPLIGQATAPPESSGPPGPSES